MRPKKYSLLRTVEWIGGNRVLVTFSSGKVVEIALPWVESAAWARIVDDGAGLDPGNGKDVNSLTLAKMPGRVLLPGRAGWVGHTARRQNRRAASRS